MLSIDFRAHNETCTLRNRLHGRPLPIITTRDLLVSKVLSKGGRSPYQGYQYLFGVMHNTIMHVTNNGFVYDGFHSLRASPNSDAALKFAQANSLHPSKANPLFPCIIPKGSAVYMGLDHDVVSNNIVVYKNMKELYKEYEKPVRVRKQSKLFEKGTDGAAQYIY